MDNLKVLAYRAFSARKLANLTNAKRDEKFATQLENELLAGLKKYDMLDQPMPTPETQEGNAEFAAWVESMEGRF